MGLSYLLLYIASNAEQTGPSDILRDMFSVCNVNILKIKPLLLALKIGVVIVFYRVELKNLSHF